MSRPVEMTQQSFTTTAEDWSDWKARVPKRRPRKIRKERGPQWWRNWEDRPRGLFEWIGVAIAVSVFIWLLPILLMAVFFAATGLFTYDKRFYRDERYL